MCLPVFVYAAAALSASHLMLILQGSFGKVVRARKKGTGDL